jgi:hypothetical protein
MVECILGFIPSQIKRWWLRGWSGIHTCPSYPYYNSHSMTHPITASSIPAGSKPALASTKQWKSPVATWGAAAATTPAPTSAARTTATGTAAAKYGWRPAGERYAPEYAAPTTPERVYGQWPDDEWRWRRHEPGHGWPTTSAAAAAAPTRHASDSNELCGDGCTPRRPTTTAAKWGSWSWGSSAATAGSANAVCDDVGAAASHDERDASTAARRTQPKWRTPVPEPDDGARAFATA